MTGHSFALRVADYLKKHGYESRSVAKIDTNPERSKHLETATTSVLGYSLDFVNLRSEQYTETSRVPSKIVSGDCGFCCNADALYLT